MWTYIRVDCEYWEFESSKYRLALMQNSLVQSLQNQTSKNFSVILTVSPMDPFFSKRVLSFDGMSWIFDYETDLETPRREVIVSDDVFLSPSFVESLEDHGYANPYEKANCLLFDGKLRRCVYHPAQVICVEFDEQGNQKHRSAIPDWIQPVSQMNRERNPLVEFVEDEPDSVSWVGWSPMIMRILCKALVLTGTAFGYDPRPSRGRSFVFAKSRFKFWGRRVKQ